jgi:hypothetical protein
MKVAALPSHIEPIAADVLPALFGTLVNPGFTWYATLGLGFLSGTPGDPAAAAGAIGSVRAGSPPSAEA